MRAPTLLVVAFGIAAVIAACSGSSGSPSPSAVTAAGLTGTTWQLTAITEKVPAFQGVVPAADQENYTIEFKADLTFTAKADCNQLAGTYATSGSDGLTIVPGPMTLAACPEGSLSSQYVAALAKASTYVIADSQLTITLTDEGTLVYK